MEKLVQKADEWIQDAGGGRRGTVGKIKVRVGSWLVPKEDRRFRTLVLSRAHGAELEYMWDAEPKRSVEWWNRHVYHMAWTFFLGMRAIPGIGARLLVKNKHT